MSRPVKPRLVSEHPLVPSFGPMETLPTGEVHLSVEGMEALRLTDDEGMDQDGAAVLMGISRQTYGRILAEARHTVTHALLTGKVLRVGGGNYQLREGRGRHRRRCGRRGHSEAELRKGEACMPRGDGTGPDSRGPSGSGNGSCGRNGRGRGNEPENISGFGRKGRGGRTATTGRVDRDWGSQNES